MPIWIIPLNLSDMLISNNTSPLSPSPLLLGVGQPVWQIIYSSRLDQAYIKVTRPCREGLALGFEP
jgi:hypothetical protein